MPKIISDVTQKIMDAAFKIYREEGFESISMRKIAKESGLAVGTVYNRFEDKQDLMAQMLAGDIERIKNIMMETVFCKEPEQALRGLVFSFVENMMNESRSIIKNLLDKQSKRDFVEQILFGASNQIKELVEELLCRVYCKHNRPLSADEAALLAEMALSMMQAAAQANGGSAAMRAEMICGLLTSYADWDWINTRITNGELSMNVERIYANQEEEYATAHF